MHTFPESGRGVGRGAPVRRTRFDVKFARGAFDVTAYAPKAFGQRTPLILAAPGWGKRGDRQAQIHKSLAGRGFTVASIPDPAFLRGDPAEPAAMRDARRAEADLGSPARIAETKAAGDLRVAAGAEMMIAALDAMLARPDFAIDEGRIGVLGYSFGGAVGVEAARRDQRIRAAANLDGWLFGPAAEGVIACAYMLILSAESTPSAARDGAGREIEAWRLRDLHAHRRNEGRPDVRFLIARKTSHHDLGAGPPAFGLPPHKAQSWRARIETLAAFFADTLDVPAAAGGRTPAADLQLVALSTLETPGPSRQ